MSKDELYSALVSLCQQVGFTTEHTYDCLHNAVESIVLDPTEDESNANER